ncbi:MAG: hypothetical protein HYX25_04665 [Candidatus Solibacter usitatus]|nr:hypothetical protein [Candidatus Solibacter usitatus]
MKRTMNIALTLAAGLLGGLLSRYLAPSPAFAQTQAPVPVPREVRAQSFILVNKEGKPLGRIGFDSDGLPVITLVDEDGRTLWSTKASLLLQSSK